MKIDHTWKFCVWGHRSNHTNCWVQAAMLRAAEKHFGMQTLWLDDENCQLGLDFHHTVFFSIEGNDHPYRIPVRDDCFYVLHNVIMDSLRCLWDMGRRLNYQVYTDSCLPENCRILGPMVHFGRDARVLYMPWATNLLPEEIDQYKEHPASRNDVVNWVGTIGGGVHGNINELEPYRQRCLEHGVSFTHRVADDADHIRLIRDSRQAPAIVGGWQRQVGYIPCRIFKNISYGQMGATNSARVNEVFGNRLVYNPDTRQLFDDIEKYSNEDTRLALMDVVKEKHTYVTWLQHMFDCANQILGN